MLPGRDKGAVMNIVESTTAYEAWLRAQLGNEVVEKDIDTKHAKMAEGPFPFLRATYWRWAETIYQACPTLKPSARSKSRPESIPN